MDVVGDSISQGLNPELGTFGWVNMLFGESVGSFPAKTNTLASLWPGITMNNSSVSGSTASEWAADKDGWLSNIKARHPDLVLVLIGGNDLSTYIEDGDLSVADLNDFRMNLTTIVTNLADNTPVPDIVLLNYYDLFDGYSSNLVGQLEVHRNLSDATLHSNQIIREVAASNACHLVDEIYDAFIHHCYGAELGDSNHQLPDYMSTPLANFDVHPITAGHSQIHDRVYAQLEYLKLHAVPESWLNLFGLSNLDNDGAADPDADGAQTWEEYVAGTIPTNRTSVFKLSAEMTPTYTLLYWDHVPHRSYNAYWSTNLTQGFHILETNLTSNAYLDTTHLAEFPIFYQLRVIMQ